MAKRKTPAEVLGAPVLPEMDFVEAAECLINLCYTIRDFNVSLDSSRSEVEIVWQQEVYSVALKDLRKFIECVKYLDDFNPYK